MSPEQLSLQPNGERFDFYALCLATRHQLEHAMRCGVTPEMNALAGWEFKGYRTIELAQVLGGRKFKKGFFLDDPSRDASVGISGYTLRTHGNTLGEPWIDKTKKGDLLRHNWFEVYPVSLSELDNKYPNGLLLNYSLSSKNKLLDRCRLQRDYIVQVYRDNADLLLGKSYIAIGSMRQETSFFVMERHNESTLS